MKRSTTNRSRPWTIVTGCGIAAGAATLVLLTNVNAVPQHQEETGTWFVLHDLGSYGGDTEATAMNNDGVVVGWTEIRLESPFGRVQPVVHRAFRWEGGGMRLLPTLGGEWSEARSVNVLGEIVGVSQTANGHAHAFVFTGGMMYDLNDRVWDDATPDDPQFVELFEANAINDQGEIVGCATVPFDDIMHAYMLIPFPGCGNDPPAPLYEFVDLGRLDGDCVALDVNDAREVVGYSGQTAVVWRGEVIAPLESTGQSIAHAINESGVAAGFADAGVDGWQPCLWAENGRRTELSMPYGWIGEVQGLNEEAEAVGWVANLSPHLLDAEDSSACFGVDTRAVLWRDGALVTLSDHVSFAYAPWMHLERAVDIDDAGRIVGSGRTPDGTWHAFILEPID